MPEDGALTEDGDPSELIPEEGEEGEPSGLAAVPDGEVDGDEPSGDVGLEGEPGVELAGEPADEGSCPGLLP